MERKDRMAEDLGREERSQYTGRQIVMFQQTGADSEPEAAKRMQGLLHDKAGLGPMASVLDMSLATYDAAQVNTAGAVILPRHQMAIVSAETAAEAIGPLSMLASDPTSAIEAVIPEKYDYLLVGVDPHTGPTFNIPPKLKDFDFAIDPSAVRRLTRLLRLLSEVSEAMREEGDVVSRELPTPAARYADNLAYTWGLQATAVSTSRYSGRNVRVAVIDTGLDVAHPDFRDRRIVRKLFAPSGTRDDPTNTHGTHCVGTACGPRQPVAGPRYGVAYEADIYALKVFDDRERPGARRGDVIAAMDFANREGCRVLSLSLGSASNGSVDEEYSRVITNLRRAGSLVVAAAGNEGRLGFKVGSPASSPDAVAVAAVDQDLRRADFSCTGALDICGPGVDVLSSVIRGGTLALDGTSMATPHVAGIAALWLQANPTWTADQLEAELRRSARRLPQSAAEVGIGLAQAPQ